MHVHDEARKANTQSCSTGKRRGSGHDVRSLLSFVHMQARYRRGANIYGLALLTVANFLLNPVLVSSSRLHLCIRTGTERSRAVCVCL